MDLDVNKNYFYMSFRYYSCKPEDFNLIAFNEDIYIHKYDKTKWIKLDLYDFGWGNECGFMKLPKLNFNELWELLVDTKIQDNKYGAAYLIEKDYPEQLLNFVMPFIKNEKKINKSILKAFKILKLDESKNRSPIVGKSNCEIERDFRYWKYVSEKIKKLLNE